jgi:outer membrane protein assembly factor BamB
VSRDDVPTWSTPTIHTGPGPAQVIVNGLRHIGGYDLKTGKELWKLRGGGDIPVPTPVAGHDLIFITNAHGMMSPIYAIRPTATGDISLSGDQRSNDHIAWSQAREGAYMQTPLVYGDYLYVCRDSGVLSVYDAKTGERKYQQRLADGKTGFTASGVAADGKVYYTSEEGGVYVIKAGPVFEQLAQNSLGEVAMATPAISEGTLLFRTRSHLVAIGPK